MCPPSMYVCDYSCRVAGVSSKVSRLVAGARRAGGAALLAALGDALEWESKTLTSALKAYLRQLPEPLLTRRLHRAFLAAASQYRTLPLHLDRPPDVNNQTVRLTVGTMKSFPNIDRLLSINEP